MLVPNSVRVYWTVPSVVAYLPWIPGTGAVEVQLRTEVVLGATLRLTVTDETNGPLLLDDTITGSGFGVFSLTLPPQPSRISVALTREGAGADPMVYGLMYTVPVPPNAQ